jgi:DNA-binding XRE family transcriptional regulator
MRTSDAMRQMRCGALAGAAELIAEGMSLRALRQAQKLTQVRLAKTLGIRTVCRAQRNAEIF